MADLGARPPDERFLILAPTGRDGPLTRAILEQAGLDALVCRSLDQLCARFESEGAAGVLLAQEVLIQGGLRQLRAMLDRQPPWSDLPVLLFTGRRSAGPSTATAETLAALGNVSLLDRPLHPITMVTAARSALRARRRQYAAREELVQRERAVQQRDQFLAMLGHELRNPLGVIQMAADMLGTSTGGSSARQLETLRRQTRNLARLVDDLLDVSRITAGKVVLDRKDVDLVALVRRAVATQTAAVEARNLQLEEELPEGPVWVDGDSVRLEQVVVNLLHNALKYTPSGGRIVASLATEDGRAVLRVRDTGVGVAVDSLERIFELFTQADGTIDRAQGGLGVGLTLARRLVELHGGTITAASPGLGLGTTFTVTLPLSARPPVADDTQAAEATAPSDGSLDVLVVEDNPDSREMLEEVLTSFGHRVTAASNGLDAVDHALERRPQVLLVDIGLPGLDGYGVARRVRAALGNRVFLVALTGYGQPDDRRRAYEAGFDVHLTKPVDIAAVRKLLTHESVPHLHRAG